MSNPASNSILDFTSNSVFNSISNSLESEFILSFKQIYIFKLVSISKS